MLRDLLRFMQQNQFIEIIYLDRHGKTSQRKLRLQSICGNQVKAYCFVRRANRVFQIDNILAAMPVTARNAGEGGAHEADQKEAGSNECYS
ncbi:WYL domain-containing protein [Brevibacillus fluminis]|uniref:WYL domain-containing protein n=1 Tax=Brevibacillus fluminis TaxID=511487 RepID=UPI003F8A2100